MKIAFVAVGLFAISTMIGCGTSEHDRHQACLAQMNFHSKMSETLRDLDNNCLRAEKRADELGLKGKGCESGTSKTLKQEDNELRAEGCAPEVADLAQFENETPAKPQPKARKQHSATQN